MSQNASQKAVPPSVGADVSAIKALLSRNLPEVFGEGDPARRRVAIQQLYNNALNKFAGDLRAMHPHYVYTPHGAPQVLHKSGRLAWGSGTARRSAPVHRYRFHYRAGRQDRGSLCLPRLAAHNDVRNGIKSSLQSSALIPPQQVCTWARASAAGGGAGIAHIPSGPRAIATTPVRDTSTRPTGSIRLMKLSIFSEAPVISNTKCSVVASMTRARNASASRNASIR